MTSTYINIFNVIVDHSDNLQFDCNLVQDKYYEPPLR